ncbi:MAG: hypothetical protein AB1513_02150 [Pseudomonadota bacterium]
MKRRLQLHPLSREHRTGRKRHARLFVTRRIPGHVELTPAHMFSWEFFGYELPDAWRMWCAMDALLAEREAEE